MPKKNPDDGFESIRSVDHERLMEIFIAALDYPTGSARFAYLDQACVDQASLRNRVEALLEAAEREESFLDAGLAGLAELTKLESMQIRDLLSSEMRPERAPKAIGPYRIDRELGRGGFGQVYLGYDEVLERPVAIKVPHQKFLPSAHAESAALNEKEQKRQELGLKILAKEYLEEARKLATLDHPNIAPVYACGCTDRFPCYIVSKYIEGMNLYARIKVSRFSPIESAQLIAKIADALHHAHQKGIYHRDIKPSNLFLDKNENPYVGDFGLALREEDIGTGQRSAGTPQYMSPEQARGEGHRVDGRTDIFSLGVVFYELLTGQRPFQGNTRDVVLEQVKNTDPRPPRHFDDKIPQELERICLKALAKKNSDRYSIAKDLVDDLQLFLQRHISSPNRFLRQPENDAGPPTALQSPSLNAQSFATKSMEQTPPGTTFAPTRDPQLKVLPRGLQSFDGHDADFFLELVPGPRDRNGLPESLRFWKQRIETTDSDEAFQVGLIFGPSGCGKSSLIKAGLLPCLSKNVITVYLEATAHNTESGLLKRVQKQCPDLSEKLGLSEALGLLRRGRGLAPGQKILIVLDQFEQWLGVQNEGGDQELIQALRQCDGEHLQCLLLVRDEFCTKAAHFLDELDIQLLKGVNTAVVDMFDREHASKVLSLFGHAFGRLPERTEDQSAEQQAFIKQALAELAQQGKFVCIRLSLFADMMKGHPWTAASLKQVGGTNGIELTFFEQSFSKSSSLIQLRQHQRGVRAVLKALLPELQNEIKGGMKSYRALLDEADYSHRPAEFDALIRTLSSELRLITPTNPDGDDEETTQQADPQQKYYQLTHDYLVRSLREWLGRKQRETRRGRSELCLEERAAIWQHRPESRQLPSLSETLLAWWHVPKKRQTPIQQKMMQTAARTYAFRWGTVLGLLLLTGTLVSYQRAHLAKDRIAKIETAIKSIEIAQGPDVGIVLNEISGPDYDLAHIVPLLKTRFYDAQGGQKQGLAYALAKFGYGDFSYLCSTIINSPREEVDNLVTALAYHKPASLAELKILSDQATVSSDWNQKARLAIIRFALGDATTALEMCRIANCPDPVQRTIFIDTLTNWQPNLTALLKPWKTTTIADFRSALACGLGGIPREQLGEDEFADAVNVLKEWFQTAGDGVTHSSAGWALRKWGVDELALKSDSQPAATQEWFVNTRKLTMIQIKPGLFVPVTPGDQNPSQSQNTTLQQLYFLSDREITFGQFQEFLQDPDCLEKDKPLDWKKQHFSVRPMLDAPIHQVNWMDAILFCNWLSHKEGLTPCYVRTASDQDSPEGDDWELVLLGTGYRLPTELEWEYACRAGTISKYSWGNDEDLFFNYAVIGCPTFEATAGKRPNGWGLFDMHGNVKEWCQDRFGNADQVGDPIENREFYRGVARGGSFREAVDVCQSDQRDQFAIPLRFVNCGFRVALRSPEQELTQSKP